MNQNRTIDFRYAPHHAQACIGLADDAHKTFVWDDGSPVSYTHLDVYKRQVQHILDVGAVQLQEP